MKIVIVAAKRSPSGKFLGALSPLSAPEISAQLLKHLLPARLNSNVDEVIMGNALQAGVGQNPARQAALLAGLHETTPCVTVNKACGSGLKAVLQASDSLRSGSKKLIIAGGMESMSNAPFLFRKGRKIKKMGTLSKGELLAFKEDYALEDSMIHDGLWCSFNKCHMGNLAEELSTKYRISRKEQDAFAYKSHQKAYASQQHFKKEITNIQLHGNVLREDETPRKDTTPERLSALQPAFANKGTITAGNASPLSDGAAALAITTESYAKKLKLKPLAIIEGYAEASADPKWYTLAPVQAVTDLLKKAKLSSYDLFEVNEAFAMQTLAVMKALKLPEEKTNIYGGAIALGHPIGASGARILVTLIHALHAQGKQRGIATLCIGGGEALAIAIRRVK